MKRFISVIVVFLTICLYGFSESKINTIYSSGEDGDYISLKRYENCMALNPSDFLEITSLEPMEKENTYAYCSIVCLNLKKETKMRKLVANIATQKKRIKYIKELHLKKLVDDVSFEDDKIIYCYQFQVK